MIGFLVSGPSYTVIVFNREDVEDVIMALATDVADDPDDYTVTEIDTHVGMNKPLPPLEQAAWDLYCQETAGSMDVRDFWEELPKRVQDLYMDKVMKDVRD